MVRAEKLSVNSSPRQPVEGGQNKTLGPVFPVAFDLIAFETAEGLRGIAFPVSIGGVEDVAQLIAGEVVFKGEKGIELGAELRATAGGRR